MLIVDEQMMDKDRIICQQGTKGIVSFASNYSHVDPRSRNRFCSVLAIDVHQKVNPMLRQGGIPDLLPAFSHGDITDNKSTRELLKTRNILESIPKDIISTLINARLQKASIQHSHTWRHSSNFSHLPHPS